MRIRRANPINARARAPHMRAPPNPAGPGGSRPCPIAPPAHCVVVVRPADDPPARPPARPRGPSMYAILSAQRMRRAAMRFYVARRYGALPQSEGGSLLGAAAPVDARETAKAAKDGPDTDSSMV